MGVTVASMIVTVVVLYAVVPSRYFGSNRGSSDGDRVGKCRCNGLVKLAVCT